MKTKSILETFVLVFTLLLTTAFTPPNKEIIIKGYLLGTFPVEILRTVPVNGNCYWGFRDTLKWDTPGEFTIRASIEKAAFIRLIGRGMSTVFLITEPGNRYDVIIELGSDGEKVFNVNGIQCDVHKLYNSFPNHDHPQLDDLWHYVDSSAFAIRKVVMDRKRTEISQIEELYQKNAISDDVYHLLVQDREVYNLNAMSMIAAISYLNKKWNGIVEHDFESYGLWGEAIDSISTSARFFQSSPMAFEFLQLAIWYPFYGSEDYEKVLEERNEMVNAGLRHTSNLELATKFLSPELIEFFTGAYLTFHSRQKKFEKELISLFEEFRNSFPNSKYLQFAQPFIDDIVHFYKELEKEDSEKTIYLKNYDEISSVEELLSGFRGKKVYMDIWATWCGPCKEEFKYGEKLKELLKSQGIEMIYFSVDRDPEHQQWKNMIKFYNLEGFHVRANNNLKDELQKIIGWQGIPHYVLFDENGQVLIRNAQRPSQIAELEKQLKNL